ncbi:MAG: 2-hydroxyacyl-CoA dehydratase [Deltaproteobacteria bacterium]|nr:2-hydroxyacyl-CoA dehydratase [Deltaproteobacteria bacterium]
MVVWDDLCIDARYSVTQVNEKGDPMNAPADRYLIKPACPCMHQGNKLDERYGFITRRIEQNRGQGVVFGLQRFCDTHLGATENQARDFFEIVEGA